LIGEAQLITRLLEVWRWAGDNFDAFVKYSFPTATTLRHYFSAMIAAYEAATRDRFPDARHIILKNPGYSYFARDLVELVPDAKLLISVRDPRDQVASDLEVGVRELEKGIENCAAADRNVLAYAQGFKRFYDPILKASNEFPDRFIFVRFEDMLLDFDTTLDRLNCFTGMTKNLFDPTKAWPRVEVDLETVRESPFFSPFYMQPLEPGRIGRYRRSLNDAEIAEIERECRGLMARFGYAPMLG